MNVFPTYSITNCMKHSISYISLLYQHYNIFYRHSSIVLSVIGDIYVRSLKGFVFSFQDSHEVDRNEGLKFARKHSMLFIGTCASVPSPWVAQPVRDFSNGFEVCGTLS